jgi:2-polyprenyl-3-methyl-5-hydroxy-6-metoxy-1,4-benzoquinol methylase
MQEAALDRSQMEQFGARLVGLLNEASLALMMSVGHRTGLFDVMATLPPSTSDDIARAAGLSERYVREWLGAMVTGRFVEYEPTRKTYRLPPEHAAFLTRAAAAHNLACFAQIVPLLGGVEDEIVARFRSGGGVPYAAFGRFPEVMRDLSAATFEARLVSHVLPFAPGLIDALTRGIDVLDIGCGSGHSTSVMARAFPNSRFSGYDLLDRQIAAAKAEAAEWRLGNVRFDARDLTSLDEPSRYDLVTAFDAIHDQAQPAEVLSRVAAALRPGGTFLMLDILASSHLEKNTNHPFGPLLYTFSCMHCMTVSLAQNGAGLGAVWGEEKARTMLDHAGFSVLAVHPVPDDPLDGCFVARKRA